MSISKLASVVHYVERSLLLLLFTSASDLPMRTNYVLFSSLRTIVHACCDKQRSLMCGGLCGIRTSTLSIYLTFFNLPRPAATATA